MIGKFTDETYRDWDTYVKCLLYKWKTPIEMYDDYIQEMFVVLIECNSSFDLCCPNCSFDTYAYNQMHWKWKKLMRQYYRDKCIVLVDENIICNESEVSQIVDIEHILNKNEYDLLKYFSEQGINKTVKKYGVSKTTIYNRINKIKRKIMEEY